MIIHCRRQRSSKAKKREEAEQDSGQISGRHRADVKGQGIQKVASLFGRLDFYMILAAVFLVPLAFSTRTFDIIELPKQVLLGALVALSLFFWLIRAVLASEFKFKRSGLNIAIYLVSSFIWSY